MPTVKYSVSAYIADGTTTDYLITWDYLDDDHITVEVDGISNADPTASHTFTKLNDTTVRVTDGIGGAIAAGKEIQIRRNTPITTRPISFADGSALLAADLNKNSDYLLYSMQEALDQVDFTVQFQQEAEAFRDETEALRDAAQSLRNLADSDAAEADAHRIAAALSETNASASEVAAAASEAAAATSEANSAVSEAALQAAQDNAEASATAAATSETAAAASESAAAISEANAAGSEAGVAADAATATSKAAAASVSESNALIYKDNAAASASNSEISAVNSANSATASANSAVQAATSENAAATSRNTAGTYATNSQASAVASEVSRVAAASSETAAASSEANAATSETNAAASEASALTSKEAAEAALDNFDDRYLGAKAADPTTDNDGDPLLTGALYFNTTDEVMKVYEGAVWVAAYASLSGALLAANNLSDVADAPAARLNLGLTGNSVLPNDAGYITISEVPANNSINEGDTAVTIVDNGTDGKVVVRVDGSDVAEFNDTHLVIPKGTSAERDPNAALGSLRYNTTIGFFETLTGSGWGAVATPPSVTSITPSNFNGEAGATFTVNGAFFDADTTAVFKGVNGTEYAAATVTFVNNSQITLTNAANLPADNEPFRVKVTNGAGLSVESAQGIDAGSVPAFTTAAGTLATTTRWDEAVSVTVQATDAENTISGYTVTEGNLPAGLTLDGTTGAITGTSTEQTTTTHTFTIGATDSAGNTNTRQFNIQIVNAAPVWNSPAEGGAEGLEQDVAGSITLTATDPEGEPVSYTSGTLPIGLSLSGNVISGTPTVVANTSVAVTASDGFASSVRNFFINVATGPYAILPARHFNLQTACSFETADLQTMIAALQAVNTSIRGNPDTQFSICTGSSSVGLDITNPVDFSFYASGCGGNIPRTDYWQDGYSNNGVGVGVFQVGGYSTSPTTIGDLYTQDYGSANYSENTSGTATITGADFSNSEIFQRVLELEYISGEYTGGDKQVDWSYYMGNMVSGSHDRATSNSRTNTSNYNLINTFTSNNKRYIYLNYNPFEAGGSPIQAGSAINFEKVALRTLVALMYWGSGDITGTTLKY